MRSGHNNTVLLVSNDEINDIIKIVKSLEESGLLLKYVSKTGKGAIATSQGQGIYRAGKGKGINRAEEGIVSAACGNNSSKMDF